MEILDLGWKKVKPQLRTRLGEEDDSEESVKNGGIVKGNLINVEFFKLVCMKEIWATDWKLDLKYIRIWMW